MKEKNYGKIQLFDAIAEARSNHGANYYIYSDYFGLGDRFDDLKITKVILAYNGEISVDEIFIKHKEDGEVKYTSFNHLNFREIAKVFSLKSYKKKHEYGYFNGSGQAITEEEYNQNRYSSRRTYLDISEDNEEEVALYEIEICIDSYLHCRSRYSYDRYFKFTSQTIDKLNHSVWKIPNGYENSYPNHALLKVGDLIYYNRVGTYRITELYEPNTEKKLFKAEYLYSGTELEVTEEIEDDVYKVPYIDYPSENLKFNEMLNENALRPYVLHDGATYNIYWIPLEEASRYTVSLYKVISGNKSRKIYHLQDYYAERNTCYLVIEKLVGSGYIFCVSAENREGEIISKSRGITDKEPRFWQEENI